MSNSIFRIFNPREPKKDPVEKRRDQLRRAQRSYRDRKDTYIKSLETEMARTKANEAKLVRESERLRGTVQTLTKLLIQNGIAIPGQEPPVSIATHSVPPIYPLRIREDAGYNSTSTSDARYDGEGVVETEPLFQTSSPESSGGYGILDGELDLSLKQYSQRKDMPGAEPRQNNEGMQVEPNNNCTRLGELDSTILGMDFVLTLESPCLGHLHGDPEKPDEPTGHALTTSAQLEFTSTLSYQRPGKPRGKLYQDVPAALLTRLLDLAADLCSDGEVTPIQAWNYIRHQPNFGGVEMRSLRNLEEKLRASVKCHGFGAVVEFGILEKAVHETFLLGQSF